MPTFGQVVSDVWGRRKKRRQTQFEAPTAGELLMKQQPAIQGAGQPAQLTGQVGGAINAPWQRAGTPEGGQPITLAFQQLPGVPGLEPQAPGGRPTPLATLTQQFAGPIQTGAQAQAAQAQIGGWGQPAPPAAAGGWQAGAPETPGYRPPYTVQTRFGPGVQTPQRDLMDLYGIGSDEAKRLLRMSPAEFEHWARGREMEQYFSGREVQFREQQFLEGQRRYMRWYWAAEATGDRQRRREEEWRAARVEELEGWSGYYSHIQSAKLPPQADEWFSSPTRFNELRRKFETEVGVGAGETQWESWLGKVNLREEWSLRGPRARGEYPGQMAGRMTSMRY